MISRKPIATAVCLLVMGAQLRVLAAPPTPIDYRVFLAAPNPGDSEVERTDVNWGSGQDSPLQRDPRVTAAQALVAVPEAEEPSFRLPISASLGLVSGDSLSATRTQLSSSMPIYAQMGPNPKEPELILMASANLGVTFLDASTQLDLPGELYSVGGGLNAIKRINDRWTAIGGINVRYQSDGRATDDVINLSGVGMLQWKKSDRVQWMFGVAATGLNDIPVLPIAGVTWKPNDDWEVSLGVPSTRLSHRVRWFGPQHETWLYTGLLGAGGGSYAVQRPNGQDDQLTINEFPLALGLERRGKGAKWYLEAGVVVGRKLEYELSGEKVNLGEGVFTRAGLKY